MDSWPEVTRIVGNLGGRTSGWNMPEYGQWRLFQKPGSAPHRSNGHRPSFTSPFCPLPPTYLLFLSGVQRHHQVLREGETAETLPTQPVQISLLWNLWQSVKTGPGEECSPRPHRGLTHLPWTELKLSLFYLFIFPPHLHALTPIFPSLPLVRSMSSLSGSWRAECWRGWGGGGEGWKAKGGTQVHSSQG